MKPGVVTPEQHTKQSLCGYNTDHTRGYSRSLLKYLAENPICKAKPQYHGYCLDHLPYKLKLQYEWENTTQEQRQQYLDLINSGKSIGEAQEIAGISFEAALEVTNRAIGNYAYLKREAE
jgi:hypothetical protein